MNIQKIAILNNQETHIVRDRHIEAIKKTLPGVEVILATNDKDLLAQTTDADILLTWHFMKFEEFCVGAPSLKWVCTLGTGVDAYMNSKVRGLDVRISSTKGIHGMPMGDQALAYIFAFLRALPFTLKNQFQRKWDRSATSLCDESVNKTVGIVGLGNIGLHLARKCKLLGMRVVATKNTPIESEWVDVCYPPSEIHTLLAESDFVVLVLPLTPETRKMMGEREFRVMKKTGVLINLARGAHVDNDALTKALWEGEIGGAALDIFEKEPLDQDSPLWDAPNIIITPHTSPFSPYYMDRAIAVFCDNLARYTQDQPILFEADKVRGY